MKSLLCYVLYSKFGGLTPVIYYIHKGTRLKFASEIVIFIQDGKLKMHEHCIVILKLQIELNIKQYFDTLVFAPSMIVTESQVYISLLNYLFM